MKNIWFDIAMDYSKKIMEYKESSKNLVGTVVECKELSFWEKERAYCLSRAFHPLMEI